MVVQGKFLQYKYHISIAIAISLTFTFLLYAPPRIMTIITYFWPLFASTTVFFVAIIAFGGISKFSTEDLDEKAGEGLLDYVAGMPEHREDAQNFN
jgi:asparagine N-glycosylation enzyme membrane subunit Stt3